MVNRESQSKLIDNSLQPRLDKVLELVLAHEVRANRAPENDRYRNTVIADTVIEKLATVPHSWYQAFSVQGNHFTTSCRNQY